MAFYRPNLNNNNNKLYNKLNYIQPNTYQNVYQNAINPNNQLNFNYNNYNSNNSLFNTDINTINELVNFNYPQPNTLSNSPNITSYYNYNDNYLINNANGVFQTSNIGLILENKTPEQLIVQNPPNNNDIMHLIRSNDNIIKNQQIQNQNLNSINNQNLMDNNNIFGQLTNNTIIKQPQIQQNQNQNLNNYNQQQMTKSKFK